MIAVSPQRIAALALRYLYLLRSSWIRIVELAYWPTVQMILWGFITQYLASHSAVIHQAGGLLLSAVLLWDVLFRSQLGLSVVFFEEMHARNLGQLFISPLRPIEMVLALMLVSLARTLIGVGVAVLLAMPFYRFNLFQLGLPLAGFFLNLVLMGWAIGLLVGRWCCVLGWARRASRGRRFSPSRRCAGFIIPSPPCLTGYNRCRGCCRPVMSLKGCARYCWLRLSGWMICCTRWC